MWQFTKLWCNEFNGTVFDNNFFHFTSGYQAYFCNSLFSSSIAQHSDFSDSDFVYTVLCRVLTVKCNFQYTQFMNCLVINARTHLCDFSGGLFQDVLMWGVVFKYSKFLYTTFDSIKSTMSCFHSCNFQNSFFSDSFFYFTDFTEANFRNTEFRNTVFFSVSFAKATFLETKFDIISFDYAVFNASIFFNC